MSEILSKEQRARIEAMCAKPKADRVETLSRRGGAIGCLLMLALMVLGLAGFVLWIWRAALHVGA